jgi:hypothetical protein
MRHESPPSRNRPQAARRLLTSQSILRILYADINRNDPGMADPPRRRGRPRHNVDGIKDSPLNIRTTKAQKDELLRAAKAAGRSLAEEIEFRLGAVRAHPAVQGEDAFEQMLARLMHVLGLVAEVQDSIEEIENWVYSTIIALSTATGAGAKLMWDEVLETFVPRPANMPPVEVQEVEPKPREPKAKSRLPRGRA